MKIVKNGSHVLTLLGPNKLSELTDTITKALPIFDLNQGIWTNLGMPVEMQTIFNIGIFLVIIYRIHFFNMSVKSAKFFLLSNEVLL